MAVPAELLLVAKAEKCHENSRSGFFCLASAATQAQGTVFFPLSLTSRVFCLHINQSMAWPDLGQGCLHSLHHIWDGTPPPRHRGPLQACRSNPEIFLTFAAFAHFLLSSLSIAFQIKVHRKPEPFLISPPPKKLEHQNQFYRQ